MKTVILFACLLGLTLAFQAEDHRRVARSSSSSDSDEIGASPPFLPQMTFDQFLQLLMALSSRNVPAPTPTPASTPVPTLAPITAR
ncbi:hypothetical protein R3I93_005925 [Phoxinus phoxinus]|uniref:Uncharacterized protein n=1 Tax=Phoxinus phoxinus TaxID=58324 RepID=A0AAN9DFB3_9TELE